MSHAAVSSLTRAAVFGGWLLALPAASGAELPASMPPPALGAPRSIAPLSTTPAAGLPLTSAVPEPGAPVPGHSGRSVPALPASAATNLPQQGSPGGEPAKNGEKADLAELKKQLEETNRRLLAMQQQLQQLTDLLRGRSGNSDGPAIPGLVEEVRRLGDKLANVEAELNRLRTQYSALSPSRPATSSASPLGGKGLVRIVNDFSTEVTMVLNGAAYRIPPRQTVDVHVPAGEFSYQLLEAGGTLVRKPIREQEVVTLRVH